MADSITVKVEGLTHVRDLLIKHIPAQARERVVVGALRRAFKPMLQAAKNNLAKSQDTGALMESMQLWKVSKRKKSNKSDTFASVEIGPRRSSKKALGRKLKGRASVTPAELKGGIRHGHLVEFGVGARNISARPFLRPALDSKGPAGIQSFAKELRIGIEKEARKQARRQRKGAK